MKLIKPYFEILEQKPRSIAIPDDMEIEPKMVRQELINTVYRQIEIAGRTCYKSEDKITPDSAAKFVERMVKSGHGAMLEHGTVYLFLTMSSRQQYFKYCSNPYSVANSTGEAEKGTWNGFVTTNYRVLVENGWLDDLEYICNPSKEHEKRITVRFIADAGVMREFFRHRVTSMAQESTRYCNYLRDKFGSSITVVYPCWLKEEEELELGEDMRVIEEIYFKWLKRGWTAQQARIFLPLGIKAEAIMTGFVKDWWGEYLIFYKETNLLDMRIHGKFPEELDEIDREKYRIVEKGFFPLRCSNTAHPQARELAIPLREEFIKRNFY